MAQLNITLNQDEILQLLSADREDAFRILLQESLNSVLKAESQEQLQAAPYERSEGRTDSRNGFRTRDLKTRIGTITLNVPRHRNQPFHTMVFENDSRSEAALVTTMAEMVVSGVSTRKVARVVETLCGLSISQSAVSDVCKDLDKEVGEFRNRPIEGDSPFLPMLTMALSMPPGRYFRTFRGNGVSFTFQRTSLTKHRRRCRLVSMLNCRKCSTARRSRMPGKSGTGFSPIIRNPLRQPWNALTRASKVL